MRSNMRTPIYIPRWVLVAKYGFFLVIAGVTAIRGSVTLDLTTPTGYTPIWCAAVAVGAVVALPASFLPKLADAEKWAAAWIAGWLSVVAVNAFFISDGAGWLYVAGITLLPAGRAIALFSKRAA